MFVMAAIHLAVLIFFEYNVLKQPFYTPPLDMSFGEDSSGASIISYEDTVLWLIANF